MRIFVIALFVVPIVLSGVPIFVGATENTWMKGISYGGLFATLIAPAVGPAIAAIFFAMCYHDRVTKYRPVADRNLFQRFIFLHWLLFAVIEYALAAIYLYGGCAIMFKIIPF